MNSQWTVLALAVLVDFVVWILSVAPITEVVCAKAMKQGNRAAEHAFPVDVSLSVNFTVFDSLFV